MYVGRNRLWVFLCNCTRNQATSHATARAKAQQIKLWQMLLDKLPGIVWHTAFNTSCCEIAKRLRILRNFTSSKVMFTLTGYLFVPTRKGIRYSVAYEYPHPTLSLSPFLLCHGEGAEGAATRRLCIMWTETAQNWNKSFTHIKHCARAVGWEGLVN